MDLDSDRRTLHVRCGSDIREPLRQAGFTGDFLEYADPICEGPVPDVPNLIEVRARYLAQGPGAGLGLSEAECRARLQNAEAALAAAHQHQRVVLWFEHDSHDQLILARILAQLAEGRLPACLELICIDNHPEAKPRFNGLGQLGPEALAGLWPFRRPVTDDQISLGKSIWQGLRDPDPTRLQSIAETPTPALPMASRALWRHLEELPAAEDGLSLTQRLILTILAENGSMPVGKLFAAMVHDREPLVFMGDLSFLLTMEAMARTTPRVLTIEDGEKPLLRAATITDTGREVLAGRRDYLTLAPAERWVGGVRVQGGAGGWRFDGIQRRVTVA